MAWPFILSMIEDRNVFAPKPSARRIILTSTGMIKPDSAVHDPIADHSQRAGRVAWHCSEDIDWCGGFKLQINMEAQPENEEF